MGRMTTKRAWSQTAEVLLKLAEGPATSAELIGADGPSPCPSAASLLHEADLNGEVEVVGYVRPVGKSRRQVQYALTAKGRARVAAIQAYRAPNDPPLIEAPEPVGDGDGSVLLYMPADMVASLRGAIDRFAAILDRAEVTK